MLSRAGTKTAWIGYVDRRDSTKIAYLDYTHYRDGKKNCMNNKLDWAAWQYKKGRTMSWIVFFPWNISRSDNPVYNFAVEEAK